MTRTEYIYHLKQRLRRLPQEEIDSAVEYVNECFDEAGKEHEQEVIDRLGKPNKFAAQIIADTVVSGSEEGNSKNNNTILKTIGLIFLGICALPIGLPVILVVLLSLFVFLVMVFVIVVVIVALIFASGIGVYSLLASGFEMLSYSTANGLLFIGSAIFIIGICLLAISGLIALFQYVFPWIADKSGKLYQKLKGGMVHEEE